MATHRVADGRGVLWARQVSFLRLSDCSVVVSAVRGRKGTSDLTVLALSKCRVVGVRRVHFRDYACNWRATESLSSQNRQCFQLFLYRPLGTVDPVVAGSGTHCVSDYGALGILKFGLMFSSFR